MSGVQCEDYAGRVEVCFDEQWGSICDSHWSGAEAGVVCGQLGFPQAGKLPSSNDNNSVITCSMCAKTPTSSMCYNFFGL